MPILFFNLREVPEDEADDIRELLNAADIEFYETTDGFWGVSLPAIWLHHPDDLPTASRLFAEYQQKREIEQRTLYEQQKQQGLHIGFWRHNLKHPIRFVLYLFIASLVIYVSLYWVIDLGI
ncbi:MAG: DUF6164 family protein [Gammaproteobacteria bacterium]